MITVLSYHRASTSGSTRQDHCSSDLVWPNQTVVGQDGILRADGIGPPCVCARAKDRLTIGPQDAFLPHTAPWLFLYNSSNDRMVVNSVRPAKSEDRLFHRLCPGLTIAPPDSIISDDLSRIWLRLSLFAGILPSIRWTMPLSASDMS